jgi:hypothetical protein
MPCRIIAIFLTLALIGGAVQAKTNPSQWSNVQKLSPGAKLIVATSKGQAFAGELKQVNNDTLTLLVRVSHSARQAVVIRREDVSEVRKMRSKGFMTALGAGVGLGAGIAIGAVYDSQHPFSDDPGIGKAIFGGMGALIGVLGGSLLPRKGKKIYVAP